MGNNKKRPSLARDKAENFNDHLSLALTDHDDAVIPERDTPHCVGWLGQLANKIAGLQVPQFDPTVVASGNDVSVVELNARNRVIVGTDPVDTLSCGHVEDNNATIRTTGSQDVVRQLQVANQ
jgi:hypothetical protein